MIPISHTHTLALTHTFTHTLTHTHTHTHTHALTHTLAHTHMYVYVTHALHGDTHGYDGIIYKFYKKHSCVSILPRSGDMASNDVKDPTHVPAVIARPGVHDRYFHEYVRRLSYVQIGVGVTCVILQIFLYGMWSTFSMLSQGLWAGGMVSYKVELYLLGGFHHVSFSVASWVIIPELWIIIYIPIN